MSKRIVLLLILGLALVACGGQETATPEATVAAPTEAEATNIPPTEAAPTEAPPTAEAVEETTAVEPTEAPAETGSIVEGQEHEPDPRLVGITWEWVRRDANGNSSPDLIATSPQDYTLLFNEDGTFNAMLDCNTGAGSYATPSPGSIFMELGPMTLAACPPGSLADEMAASLNGPVQSYRFEDDEQTLIMAWVAGGPEDYYRNADVPLPGEAEVEAIPADAIQLDLNGLATSYSWEVIPSRPMPQQGPGGQGYPTHILITFDGTTAEDAVNNQLQRIYIFPTQAYVDLYNNEGNETVAAQVVRLGQLISTADGRTTLPDSPMPLLPPPNSFMDRWAQFQDLDFGAGQGVRYVSDSPLRPAIGVWTNSSTGYYYQGLSTDQTFYVSMYWPVATAALPNSVADATEEQTAAATNPDTNAAYIQETEDTLNALTSADWTPDLALLDAMAASLTFPLPGDGEETSEGSDEAATPEATATPETAGEADSGAEEESILPTPAAGEPSATVTAPDGIFVRSGPGTEYPDIAVAATNATAKVTGVSEDRQWWVIEVPLSVAEDQQGWVSATWVETTNTAGVPVIPAPEVDAEQQALTGVTWQWVSTTTPAGPTNVTEPTRYTILFNADGSAAVTADCNQVGASYSTDGSAISITLGPSTLAACEPGSQDQEFLAGLTAAALYFFQDGDLFMDLTADGGTMRFTAGSGSAPVPEATATPDDGSATSPVQNVPFQLVSFGPQGAEQSPIAGTTITATFSGQTVSGNAGCNDYSGQVTPVDDYFTIGGIAATQQACVEPAGVMEQEQAYLTALAATAGYEWQQDANNGNVLTGGRLFYSLADGTTGFLNFVAQ